MTQREKRIVLDVDETLVNSVKKHVRLLNGVYGGAGIENLPDYETVKAKGGTHKAYAHIPTYPKLNEAMRGSERFNRNQEAMPGAVEGVNSLDDNGCRVEAYLTTRPDNLMEVTKQELDRHGFPKARVICRPENVPLEKTTDWKVGVLADMADVNDRVVMIDDSPGLIRAVEDCGRVDLRGVVYPGPNTRKEEARGLHIADWTSMEDVIKIL